MRFITICIAFLFLSVTHAMAQGTIKGKVTDSSTKKALALATVTIFKAADTALITYRMSAPEGDFKVTGLPLNIACRAVISFSGYEVYRKEFTLTDNTSIDLGTIALAPAATSLDEVLVIAERPPVTVRKDTIEFNAASFKTLPTALVEDILKKLPGVQVDADGNITVNGKKVNRIMVDGKDFFGSDPKMATRNLPANIVDKVQVTEDKDERELNPDRSEGDIGQVINLKLKKAIKKGWFGKAYAGAGTDERYEGGAIVNLFKDTMQVSLLGFTNNLNRAGFSFNDIRSLGGFSRSGINSLWMNGNGGVSVNGISLGGTGDGINQSTGAGFNMNHVLKNGLTLNSQYFYGQSRNDILELNNRQQFLSDTTLVTRSNRNEVLKSYSHRVAFGLKGKIDSLSRIDFKPSFVINDQHSNKFTGTSSSSNIDGLLNTSNNQQNMDGKDVSYSHSLLYFKNFRKKDRSLNIANSLSYGNLDNSQINDVINTFYESSSALETYLNQLRDREQNNFTTTLNANYNEPITKLLNLRLGYSGTYFNNVDQLGTFNKGGGSKYDVVNANLSNELSRESWRNAVSAGLNVKYKKLNVTGTASFLKLDINNQFGKSVTDVNQRYSYVLPGMTVNWRELNLNYSANATPPNLSDLQPVPDSTNPLFIVNGNPDLKPATAHSINLNYFKNISTKNLFISAYGFGNFRNNAVTRSRVVQTNGVQVTTPVNVDGVQDLYTNLNVVKQHKANKNFQFGYGVGYNVNFNRNYLIVNGRKGYVKTLDIGPFANGNINWKDKIEWSYSYYLGFNRTNYENDQFKDLKVDRSGLRTELVVRWPKHIVWESNLALSKNSNVAPGVQKNVALWNAAMSVVFLKDDKGQLKFSAFDLLNENISVFRNTTENQIIDRQINILQQYFMATFTYNIRSFKGAKVGSVTDRFFRF
ncbi:outer membrane beta-barrel protein [Flavisolibacter tropicus]|uniref:Outer membrane protein beta-barrel domain-containing protein n=1 Tax=Flavisolibacter tropicus TaxID=1492898 RepID=A0A172TW56_9BACT|nr:outer membrane beta-barrel protein [Flavisolibacter tropicus]ANE51188.1 hypothetical protein SY85_12425 [Flavisolibacter tropicus]